MSNIKRIVCWFSCGAASAVATKLAISDNAGKLPLTIVYTEVAEEHPDNKRFLKECEKWFGLPVNVLRNEKYKASCDEVFIRERYLVGVQGAPCTKYLKRGERAKFEKEGDLQVFGYTAEEVDRADSFFERNEHINRSTPLIERGLEKSDCLAMIADAGIEIPAMYTLGYKNNNCIGCVKGGAGYWNKIRIDFPERFKRMSGIERDIGASIIRRDGKNIYLDELPVGMGNHQTEPDIECSIFCHIAKAEYSA